MLYFVEERALLARRSTAVGTPVMAELDREMTPVLADLMTLGTEGNLGTGNVGYPAAKKLFDWLVEPNRTAEEFTYVLGPLKWHVLEIMMQNFRRYVYDDYCYGAVDIVAAEALAAKNLILGGS